MGILSAIFGYTILKGLYKSELVKSIDIKYLAGDYLYSIRFIKCNRYTILVVK